MSSRTSIFTAPVVHTCVAAFVAATAFGAWGAGAPDVAHGTFKSQAITLEVRSAIAFKGKSYLGADDVLIVAVTNAKVHGDALADYYDRKRAVEKRIKDDDTGVVYFEFRPDGSYRGLSYYFASGNGCGFCTSEVSSTVRLGGGKLSGTLTGTEKDRPFEVVLNVPVMSDDHGSALPADGGAPRAAYLAYHAALVSAIVRRSNRFYRSTGNRRGRTSRRRETSGSSSITSPRSIRTSRCTSCAASSRAIPRSCWSAATRWWAALPARRCS